MAAARKNIDLTAGDLHMGCGADAVTLRFNIQTSAGSIHKSGRSIVSILRMDPVLACVDGQRSVFDPHTVIGIQPMAGGVDSVISACKDQIILAGNSMPRRRGNCQTAGAVEGQILLRKYDCINGVLIDCDETAAIGQGVLLPFRQSHKHLVRLLDIQCCRRGAGDRCAVQNDLDLGFFSSVYDDHTIVQATPKDECPLTCDRHSGTGYIHLIGIAGNRIAIQCNHRAVAFGELRLIVPICEHIVIRLGKIRLHRSRGRSFSGGGSGRIRRIDCFQNTASAQQNCQ